MFVFLFVYPFFFFLKYIFILIIENWRQRTSGINCSYVRDTELYGKRMMYIKCV